MGLEDRRAWWSRHGERELRCILMTAWDPIGVGFEPNAWDEYDDYALTIGRRLYEAVDEEAAREHVAAAMRFKPTYRQVWERRLDRFGAYVEEPSVFEVIDRPRRIVLTTTEVRPEGSGFDFTVEFTFEEQDGRTRMSVIQSGFPTPEPREEHGRGVPNAFARLERAIRAAKWPPQRPRATSD